jgi:hypothetical protein
MADYQALAADFQNIMKQLTAQRAAVRRGSEQDGPSAATDAAVAAIIALVDALKQKLASAPLTDEERKRKVAALQSEIDLLKVIDATDPDIQHRLQAERDIARLTARLGVYQSEEALKFDDLLDNDGNVLETLVAEAAKDVAARQNLARVLTGIEVALRAAAFGATLAAKLAIAA